MTNVLASNSPVRSDGDERLEDEVSLCKGQMRYGQLTGVEFAAAPEHDIEIQYSWSPTTATTPAELALEAFQFLKHFPRLKIALDQCYRIGKVAAGAAARRVKKDRGCIEQAELRIEPGNGGFDHACRTAVSAVEPI